MVEAFLVSASATDDVAYIALRDLSETLGDDEGTGIIGGHMVSLLTARFPSPGFVARRTNDADGGIPKALARSGDVHDKLLVLGYEAINGNRYVRDAGESEGGGSTRRRRGGPGWTPAEHFTSWLATARRVRRG